MNEPKKLLEELKTALSQKTIQSEQLEKIVSDYKVSGTSEKPIKQLSRFSIALGFYYVGAIFVFAAYVTFLSTIWSSLPDVTKLALTLSATTIAYMIGVILNASWKYKQFTIIFFILAILFGIHATAAAISVVNEGFVLTFVRYSVTALFALTSFISYKLLKRDIFLLATILSVTALYLPIIVDLFGRNLFGSVYVVWVIVIGISYISLANYLIGKKHLVLTFLLLIGGTFIILTSGLYMTLNLISAGSSDVEITVWRVIYPFILLLFYIYGAIIKRLSFLAISSVFTLLYIIGLSADLSAYVPFIIAGVSVIILGLLTYKFSKFYKKSYSIGNSD